MIECDFCEKPAEWDAPTLMGPWANMCMGCFGQHAAPYAEKIGSRVNKHKISSNPVYDAAVEQAYINSLTEADLEELFFDSIVPTACPDGCEVEPDGRCCHGYSSPLILLGLL